MFEENQNKFLKKINFPYKNLRKGQFNFLNDVYNSIEKNKNLLVCAPTGLGKSVSALAPAIAFAKKNDMSVICLTSRQTQANQLLKTVKDISEKYSEPIKVASFVGKRNMCALDEKENYQASEFNEFCKNMKEKGKCPYFRNFRNPEYEEKINELLNNTNNEHLNVENFIHTVSSPININGKIIEGFCPYELAMKKAYKADVIICDFNYLFMPNISETFFGKIGRTIDECILIVDEAHNLPNRIRNSFSFKLSSESIVLAQKELKNFVKTSEYDNILLALNDTFSQIYLDKLMGKTNETLIHKNLFFEIFYEKLDTYYKDKYKNNLNKLIDELKEIEIIVKESKMISYVGNIANFLEKFNKLNEEVYVSTLEKKITPNKTILTLNLKNLDPSVFSSKIINNTYSTILMSATLSPLEMYAEILGIRNYSTLDLDSPFEKEKQLSLIIDDVTTQYTKRSDEMYQKIANHIENILKITEDKNAICFFPSYDLMEKITSKINLIKLNRKVLKEKKYMTKEEKEKYIEEFKTNFSNKSICLFAITSGSFAEGVDLPSNSLEEVIIVGLPLSVPDIFTKSLIEYYNKKFNKGQMYGYIYPAMNKIIQAAGRCIRTETDKGIIIFMDYRFLWNNYLKAFPKHYALKKATNYEEKIKEFLSK